ncbi:hypothetical protein B7R54_07325 [Subtercola boreus]|uniref:Uncharacterized protein n=1 Tax=Subtercola boreus TaxID=120213 RepID=A0A3E0VGI0_9MICO|nr:hypothetical protein [Subtercola boreus]RFA09056.1 hypothetical protein B7R54_07325 [Subtercola boreus]TQL53944.1 hypothetical protein FB464_1464 [Subtercola boreus]
MSENRHTSTEGTESESTSFERRFPRRMLFATAAAGAAGVAAGTAATSAAPAVAAPGTTAWMLGGNSTVASTNFLGPTNSGANLVFKTKVSVATGVTEKMRLTSVGRLGLGVTDPQARLDAVSSTVGLKGTCTSTTSAGRGVVGTASGGYGVYGLSSNGYGVWGESSGNVGVFGKGSYTGVWARGTSYGLIGTDGTYGGYLNGSSYGLYASGPVGVYASGTTSGVHGEGATGVEGKGSSTGVYGSGPTGVSGYSADPNGNAVYGGGGQYGVHGVNGRTAGVRGDSNYVGVWAQAPTFALYAESTAAADGNYAIFAKATAPAYAVFAQGNAHVNGTLSKAAGSFRIDHPLDPDNKWLSHSFVESPDMMNVYNGNVTTDGSGNATIDLPSYFSALNRDFRYQLTVIGTFAQAIVSQKVDGNRFSIKTDKPKIEVSWQVTGIRKDDYAQDNPIVVETTKDKTEAGTRQYVAANAGARSSAKVWQPGPGAPTDSTAPVTPADAGKPEAPTQRPLAKAEAVDPLAP